MVGEPQAYQQPYNNPVVLGQVMSNNDSDWSVFWARGKNSHKVPDASNLWVGKHVGEDTDRQRADETLGYLVIEAGSGETDGIAYEAGVTEEAVYGTGYDKPFPYPQPYSLAAADSAVVSAVALQGADPGWPVLWDIDPLSGGELDVVYMEDRIADDETAHGAESVAYLLVGTDPVSPGPKLAHGLVENVGDAWQTVRLPETYAEPVIVASAQYPGPSLPVVVRIRNTTTEQFELRVQNPAGQPVSDDYAVQWVVAEAGIYTEAQHGIKMEAVRAVSHGTDGNFVDIAGYVGEQQVYLQTYNSPVVLGQVMSDYDSRWSVFWAHGGLGSLGSRTPPESDSLWIGKHIGEDTYAPTRSFSRTNELLGYLVIEAGSGTVDGVGYEAAVSPTVVEGTMNNVTPPPYPVNTLLQGAGGVVSVAGLLGGDGSWPILYGTDPFADRQIDMAIEEDDIYDAESFHQAESPAYLLFDQ